MSLIQNTPTPHEVITREGEVVPIKKRNGGRAGMVPRLPLIESGGVRLSSERRFPRWGNRPRLFYRITSPEALNSVEQRE